MPAVSMVCDSSIVSAAIRDSLAPSVSSTSDAFSSTDSRIDANLKGASLTKVVYEEVGTYTSVLDKLKLKYTVLKANSNSNGLTKSTILTNGANKLNPAATQDPGNGQKAKEKVSLPTPSRILYPREKIPIGWKNGAHRFNTGAGMTNLGNTCYLNSSLQALFHIPSFANWLVSDQVHRENCTLRNAGEFCSICALSSTLIESQGAREAIRPLKICHNLRTICKHLTMNRQEDAHEFLRFLLESCEQAFIRRFKDNKEFDPYIKQTTPINNIFGGYFRVEIKCSKCQYISTSFQYFMDLILDVNSQQYRTMEDSLNHYFKREPLSDGWTCPQCKKNVYATKQWLIERPPIVVCIQLKKFTQNGLKVSKQIEIKPKIDLAPYLADKSVEKVSYKLVSVVNHFGTSINCGHYTASCLSENGSYYRFDDNSVLPTNLATALNSTAYVLFYELEEPLHKTQKLMKTAAVSTPSPAPTCTNGHNNRVLGLHNGQNSSHDTSNGTTTPVKKLLIPFIGPILPTLSSPSNDKSPEKEKMAKPVFTPLTPIKSSPPPTPIANSKLVSNILSKSKMQNSPKDENKSPNKIVLNINKNLNGNGSIWPSNGSEKKQTLPSMPNLSSPISSSEIKHNGHSLPTTPPKTPVKSLVPYNASDNDEDEDDEGHSSLSPASSTDKSPCVIETKAGIWKVSDNSRSSSPAVVKTNGHSSNGMTIGHNTTNGETIDHLIKHSLQGYGTLDVNSWSGEKTAMEMEVLEEKRRERKRQMEDDRETDMDRGHVKKPRQFNAKPQYNGNNGHQNSFQNYQNNQNHNGGNYNNVFHNRSNNSWMNNNSQKNRFNFQHNNGYNKNNKHYNQNRNFNRHRNNQYDNHKSYNNYNNHNHNR